MLIADRNIEIIDPYEVLLNSAIEVVFSAREGLLEKANFLKLMKFPNAEANLILKDMILLSFHESAKYQQIDILSEEEIGELFQSVLEEIASSKADDKLFAKVKDIVDTNLSKKISSKKQVLKVNPEQEFQELVAKNKDFIKTTLEMLYHSNADTVTEKELRRRAIDNIWRGLLSANSKGFEVLSKEFSLFDEQELIGDRQRSQLKTAFLLRLFFKNINLIKHAEALNLRHDRAYVSNYLQVHAINFENIGQEFRGLYYQSEVSASFSGFNGAKRGFSAAEVAHSLVPLVKASNLSYSDIAFLGQLIKDFVAQENDNLLEPSSQEIKYTLFLTQLKLLTLKAAHQRGEPVSLKREDFLQEMINIFEILANNRVRTQTSEFSNQVAQMLWTLDDDSKFYESLFLDFVAQNIDSTQFTEVAVAFVYALITIPQLDGSVIYTGIAPGERRGHVDRMQQELNRRIGADF